MSEECLMDSTKIDAAVSTLLDVNLPGQYDSIAKIGEIPYQANRKALRSFDIKSDEKEGRKQAQLVVSGIDRLLKELKTFAHDARILTRRTTGLQPPKDDSRMEESGPEVGSPEEGND
jgi:hypothetical protein